MFYEIESLSNLGEVGSKNIWVREWLMPKSMLCLHYLRSTNIHSLTQPKNTCHAYDQPDSSSSSPSYIYIYHHSSFSHFISYFIITYNQFWIMTAAAAHIARTVVGIIGWLSLLISTPK